jgi:uncharacterized protein with NAD-binding domain and iron-sulfur cluster
LRGVHVATKPLKVAVIGGGCAAMAAVWELSRPEHGGRFEITVFQEGWRLGGKGASGRGVNGRIEEHGLHIWLGFYDNAFRMMRECHAELEAGGLGEIYGDWRDAWTEENDVALFSVAERGGFERWDTRMPPRAGLPGDPLPAGEVFSVTYYMGRAFDLFRTLLLDTTVEGRGHFDPAGETADLSNSVREFARLGRFAGVAALAEAVGLVASVLRGVGSTPAAGLNALAEQACEGLRDWLETRWLADDRRRFMWEVADLALATMVGVIRYGLLTDPRGLDAIDDFECREFLRMNGASVRALQSPFLRGLFDLSMGYAAGDENRPMLSAGQGLRGTLRTFFGYRGAFMWRMRAGMGDVVFAPLYTALERRGVKFEFFHRLTNVGLSPARPPGDAGRDWVTKLTFDVQACTASGGAYSPLVEVSGRPCWRSRPDLAQLQDGDRIAAEGWNLESHWDRRRVGERTLTVGRDFDFVVLAVGVGAVPHLCGEILARDERWRRMTEDVTTVASQAFQVWLNEDLESLGWQGPAYITGAFAKPFDTWCDMAHVIPEEAWAKRPRTSVYFCAVLSDPPEAPRDDDQDYPARRAEEVRESARAFLEGPIRAVWPGAYDNEGGFRWEILAAGDGTPGAGPHGPGRFDTQYWRANVNPSDRYVIHTPGSFRSRISPLDMAYDNLTIAGDWTDSGFHSGCVEGAVMSGLLAASALSGSPRLEDIIAYDHP